MLASTAGSLGLLSVMNCCASSGSSSGSHRLIGDGIVREVLIGLPGIGTFILAGGLGLFILACDVT
jgi:hypothetical protein